MVRRANAADARAIARMLDAFNREFGEPSPGPEMLTRRVLDDTAARALYESVGFSNETEGPSNARSLFYELEF